MQSKVFINKSIDDLTTEELDIEIAERQKRLSPEAKEAFNMMWNYCMELQETDRQQFLDSIAWLFGLPDGSPSIRLVWLAGADRDLKQRII